MLKNDCDKTNFSLFCSDLTAHVSCRMNRNNEVSSSQRSAVLCSSLWIKPDRRKPLRWWKTTWIISPRESASEIMPLPIGSALCGPPSALTLDFCWFCLCCWVVDHLQLELHPLTGIWVILSALALMIHYKTKCVWSMIVAVLHDCRITCASMDQWGAFVHL